MIDYGPESALLWVVFLDADGACWTVPNAEVRMSFNWTLGRRKPEDRAEPELVPERESPPAAATLRVLSRAASEGEKR